MPIRSPVRSPIYSPIWGATGSRYGNGADALLAAMGLAGAENVAAFDFATSTGRIKDTTTPANNWSGALADKLTYSGSTKYRRNSAGVLVPATGILPEYDAAGANIGFRSEQQDINRLLWSSDLSNAAWSRLSMPTAPAAALGPDGTMSAWTLTDDQAALHSQLSQSFAVNLDTATHHVRVWVKKAPSISTAIPGFDLYLTGGTPVSAFPRVDPYTGTGVLGAVVTGMGDWWEVRCPIVNNGTNNTLTVNFVPAVRTTIAGADDAAAQGSNTFWNPQSGLRAFSSPIVTTTAQVSRTYDSLSLAGGLFPAPSSGGVLLVDWTPGAGIAEVGGVSVLGSSLPLANNRVDIRNTPTYSIISSGGATQANINPGVDYRGIRHKVAIRWKTNSARLAVNGALVGSEDTSVTLPVDLASLWLALDGNPSVYVFQGHVRSLIVLPGADSTDADIIAMSTL